MLVSSRGPSCVWWDSELRRSSAPSPFGAGPRSGQELPAGRRSLVAGVTAAGTLASGTVRSMVRAIARRPPGSGNPADAIALRAAPSEQNSSGVRRPSRRPAERSDGGLRDAERSDGVCRERDRSVVGAIEGSSILATVRSSVRACRERDRSVDGASMKSSPRSVSRRCEHEVVGASMKSSARSVSRRCEHEVVTAIGQSSVRSVGRRCEHAVVGASMKSSARSVGRRCEHEVVGAIGRSVGRWCENDRPRESGRRCDRGVEHSRADSTERTGLEHEAAALGASSMAASGSPSPDARTPPSMRLGPRMNLRGGAMKRGGASTSAEQESCLEWLHGGLTNRPPAPRRLLPRDRAQRMRLGGPHGWRGAGRAAALGVGRTGARTDRADGG